MPQKVLEVNLCNALIHYWEGTSIMLNTPFLWDFNSHFQCIMFLPNQCHSILFSKAASQKHSLLNPMLPFCSSYTTKGQAKKISISFRCSSAMTAKPWVVSRCVHHTFCSFATRVLPEYLSCEWLRLCKGIVYIWRVKILDRAMEFSSLFAWSRKSNPRCNCRSLIVVGFCHGVFLTVVVKFCYAFVMLCTQRGGSGWLADTSSTKVIGLVQWC